MKLVGVDLGSKSIKAVEIEHKRGKAVLEAYASGRPFKRGLKSEQLLDHESDIQVLKDLFRESSFTTNEVNVALSEADVFNQVITLPKMSPKELAKSIQWEAQQYIPLKIESVNFDYQVLESVGDKIRVLLVAAPKEVTARYIKFIEGAGLVPVGIETSIQALSRLNQFSEANQGATLLVSLGAATTDLGVIDKKTVRLTRSISIGGDTLSLAVSDRLKIPVEQAEEYNKSYGLEDTSLDGKITAALLPVLETLVKEVRRSIDFYTSRNYGEAVARTAFCGGPALLPGLITLFASKLGLEAQLIDPFVGLEIPSNFKREELEELGPSYALAVGLALRQNG